ncbi:amino acid ABC transporter ATP-binding protein [Desemzia sp. FAM 23991]|uniref:amino acid ABC transporter ATP-binding protein n=1 Tax=unclassified Desemzia TaxID=2685243 RepID=UPI00388B7369
MINLRGIEKSFDGNKVLKGIDLEIKSGEVVALIGPSGTGKTTLLRTINFLEKADKGSITIDELTIDNEQVSEKDIIQMRRQTAMVFQNYNLFRNKTILENVMEGLVVVQKKSKEEAKKIARQEIERVGLLDKVDQYPVELSGGQQQRIGIARAMALHPKVMLLDEPTSSLDPERSLEVLKVLQKVAKTGMTMVIATHEMDFAKYVSNHVVFMENGYVVEEGPPEKIFSHPTEERTKQFVQELENPFSEQV